MNRNRHKWNLFALALSVFIVWIVLKFSSYNKAIKLRAKNASILILQNDSILRDTSDTVKQDTVPAVSRKAYNKPEADPLKAIQKFRVSKFEEIEPNFLISYKKSPDNLCRETVVTEINNSSFYDFPESKCDLKDFAILAYDRLPIQINFDQLTLQSPPHNIALQKRKSKKFSIVIGQDFIDNNKVNLAREKSRIEEGLNLLFKKIYLGFEFQIADFEILKETPFMPEEESHQITADNEKLRVHFTDTPGNNAWYDENTICIDTSDFKSITILAHELCHAIDNKRLTDLYNSRDTCFTLIPDLKKNLMYANGGSANYHFTLRQVFKAHRFCSSDHYCECRKHHYFPRAAILEFHNFTSQEMGSIESGINFEKDSQIGDLKAPQFAYHLGVLLEYFENYELDLFELDESFINIDLFWFLHSCLPIQKNDQALVSQIIFDSQVIYQTSEFQIDHLAEKILTMERRTKEKYLQYFAFIQKNLPDLQFDRQRLLELFGEEGLQKIQKLRISAPYIVKQRSVLQ